MTTLKTALLAVAAAIALLGAAVLAVPSAQGVCGAHVACPEGWALEPDSPENPDARQDSGE